VNYSAPAAKKDAASCDMPREDASTLRSGDLLMRLRAAVHPPHAGNPDRASTESPKGFGLKETGPPVGKGSRRRTPGNEASEYRQEKKANAIPVVTASETGTGQPEPARKRSGDVGR